MGSGEAFMNKAAARSDGPRLGRFAEPIQSQQRSDVQERFAAAKRPVIITGSGMDTASRVPPLRDPKSGEKIAAASGPATDERMPELWGLWDRYRRMSRMAPPNPGHDALVRWQERLDQDGHGEVTIVTTNVTGLHQKAGSRRVVDLHGNVHAAVCLGEKQHATLLRDAMFSEVGAVPSCPHCERPLRPAVTLEGEVPGQVERDVAEGALRAADLVVVVGSRGRSMSVRTMVDACRLGGLPVVLVNDEPWLHGMPFVAGVVGNAAQILPMVCPAPTLT